MNTIEKSLGTELYRRIDETIRGIQNNTINLETYDNRFQAFKKQMEVKKVDEKTMKTINNIYFTIRRYYLIGDDEQRWHMRQ